MKLLILIPTMPFGKIPWQLSTWISNIVPTLGKMKIETNVSFVMGKQGVCSTRNRCCHAFLKSDADVMLTIDDDAIPDLDGMMHLIEDIQRDDVDVVAGWSLMQAGPGGAPNVFSEHSEEANGTFCDPHLAHSRGMHELKGKSVGAHVVMMKRRVIEGFWDREVQWFEDIFNKKKEDGEKFGCRHLGHDLHFFQKSHEFGFRCWLDSRVFWGHVKEVDLRDAYTHIGSLYDEIASFRPIASMLRTLWGNEAWTAGSVYLMRMAREVALVPEDEIVLECGSGLTTSILSQMLPATRFLSLEEDEKQAQETRTRPGVNGSVWHAPLTPRDKYDWYGLPDLKGRKIGLVVCDGPRGTTRGGRYGALPELYPHLADNYMVLLDDAHRQPELDILKAWGSEFGPLTINMVKDDHGKEFATVEGKKE